LKKHFPSQIYSLEIAYKSFEIAYVIFGIITFMTFQSSGKLFLSYRFARENAFRKLLEAFLNFEKHFRLEISSLEIVNLAKKSFKSLHVFFAYDYKAFVSYF
jgi:hypothetical protein